MIAPIALQAFELADKGMNVKVDDDQLMITRNDDKPVKINCIFTKDEILQLLSSGSISMDLQEVLLDALQRYINKNVSISSITYNESIKKLTERSMTPKDFL